MPALIHVTDLYHPPQDPDDHVDLATIYALAEWDLRAVVLDVTRRFVEGLGGAEDFPREPGFVPVAQMNYLTGRAAPAGVGPWEPLRSPADTAADRPRQEQAGVELLLRTLREADEKVFISVVGSARSVTAAFNREPALLREKVAAVLLNAGSSGSFIEWNVELDRAAYVGLFRSGLPVWWFPCATGTGPFDAGGEHNTYFLAQHHDLFRGLSRPVRAWFAHAFCGNLRGDIVRALDEQGTHVIWEQVLAGRRNLWSVASLVMAAGRKLSHTADGWRFVPGDAAAGDQPLSLMPVDVAVDDDGTTRWSPAASSHMRLFRRDPENGSSLGQAMTQALNALLCGLGG